MNHTRSAPEAADYHTRSRRLQTSKVITGITNYYHIYQANVEADNEDMHSALSLTLSTTCSHSSHRSVYI